MCLLKYDEGGSQIRIIKIIVVIMMIIVMIVLMT